MLDKEDIVQLQMLVEEELTYLEKKIENEKQVLGEDYEDGYYQNKHNRINKLRLKLSRVSIDLWNDKEVVLRNGKNRK